MASVVESKVVFDALRPWPVNPGRPRVAVDIETLVLKMARENLGWGYTRLCGALSNLGYDVGRSTVKRILLRAGMDPAPERLRSMSWSAFLRAHWRAIAAADFFTVEALTLHGLVRYHVLFVMELSSRRVQICGLRADPDGEWMKNITRGLLDEVDGLLLGKRHLIVDRDPLFTAEVRALLRRGGCEVLRLPARSPNLNAYAERFVRSVRSECLSRVIPLGRGHLEELLREYSAHYHRERNHQGLKNALIEPIGSPVIAGRIVRRPRLGGLLNHYEREAA